MRETAKEKDKGKKGEREAEVQRHTTAADEEEREDREGRQAYAGRERNRQMCKDIIHLASAYRAPTTCPPLSETLGVRQWTKETKARPHESLRWENREIQRDR